MATSRTVLLLTLLGATLGQLAGTLAARTFIPWYNTPGEGAQALCDLPRVTLAAIDDVIRYQLIGAGLGGLACCIVGLMSARRRKPAGAAEGNG